MSYFVYCEDCGYQGKTISMNHDSRKDARKIVDKHQIDEGHDCYVLENQEEDPETRSDLN